MKTFIATISKSTVSRTYGGANEVAQIYRVARNKPVFVAEATWCTRGYRGDVHEVMNELCDGGFLPKKYRGYYKPGNGKFEIVMI